MSMRVANVIHDDPAVSMPRIDEGANKAALAEFPAAVIVVTCWGNNGAPVGATPSSCGSLSINSPLMFAAFDRGSATLKALSTPGKRFLIHLMSEGQERAALMLASKGPDKFHQVVCRQTRYGPQIANCAQVFPCAVQALVPAGDHVIVTGAVHGLEEDGIRQPLLHHRRELYAVPARA
ncbi:flavin reductase family protein [Hansschlegelia quercus]|nr:flavin reductase family protein [Hansschlegelia quercus]